AGARADHDARPLRALRLLLPDHRRVGDGRLGAGREPKSRPTGRGPLPRGDGHRPHGDRQLPSEPSRGADHRSRHRGAALRLRRARARAAPLESRGGGGPAMKSGPPPANEIPETGTAYLDGAFVPFADAKVSIATHALQYGTGVFEGIRA